MNQNTQPLIKVMITLVILSAITASILMFTSGSLSEVFDGKLFNICYSFLLYCVTGAICWAVTRKKEYLVLGNAGIVISILGFIMFTIFLLDDNKTASTAKFTFSFMVAAIGLAQICFLFYLSAQNRFTLAARMVATIAIATYSLLLIARIFSFWDNLYEESEYMGLTMENYLKAILSLFIIGVASCVLVPLCNRLETGPRELELETKVDPPAVS
jgi:hypothetical protein